MVLVGPWKDAASRSGERILRLLVLSRGREAFNGSLHQQNYGIKHETPQPFLSAGHWDTVSLQVQVQKRCQCQILVKFWNPSNWHRNDEIDQI